MKTAKLVFGMSICAILMLAGCATTLTPAGSKVKLGKADPPMTCTEVGGVSDYQSVQSPTYMEQLKNGLRNKAAEMGANYVRMDMLSGLNINGTAFQCPDEMLNPAAPPAPEAAPTPSTSL